MSKAEFDIAFAMYRINSRVEQGVNTTVEEIFDMAVQLAPVRKKGRRKKRTSAVGGVRTKHDFPVGRSRNISVTGGQFYEAFSKLPTYTRADGTKETVTRAQFRKMKIHTPVRNRKVVTPEEYDKRSAASSSGKPRGVVKGSETTDPQGHLRDRIYRTEVKNENGRLSASVISPAKYSRFVEFPTRRTAAQPFLLPAFKAARSRLKSNIKAAK